MDLEMTWAKIPDVVLLNVYTILPKRDRFSMSVVCKNWNRLFESASLWREYKLDIGGRNLTTAEHERIKSVQFAKRYGKFVKKLTVIWRHNPVLTWEYFRNVLSDFLLHRFSSTKLVEFNLLQAKFHRFWRYDCNQNALVTSLSRFFRKQRRLKAVNLTSSHMTLVNGCKILKTIGQSSGRTVEKLLIEDMFQQRVFIFLSSKFLRCMDLFSNLNHLSTNYCYLSEEIVRTWTVKLAGKLKYIGIKVHKDEPHNHTISQKTWNAFVNACPKLRAKMTFVNIKFGEMLPIFNQEIPLKDIKFLCRYTDDSDITGTLIYISEVYRNTLEDLEIDLYNDNEMIDDAVVFLLGKCQLLKNLTLNAVIMIPTIDMICEKRREGQLKLSSFHVTACGLGEEDREMLSDVRNKHEPMIKKMGLDFSFSTEMVAES